MPRRSLPDIPFRFLDIKARRSPGPGSASRPARSAGSIIAGLFAHLVCAWRTAMRNVELSLFLAVGASAAGMLYMRPNRAILVVIAVRWLLSTAALPLRSGGG